VNSVL
jgi:hypothetical protein